MAVSLTAGEIFDRLGVTDPQERNAALQIAETATLLVDRYAPDAPTPVSNEAAIRCTGWLLEAPSSGAVRERTGDLATTFSPESTGALRASGAMGLLSPWKIRRAGAIGGPLP